MRVCRRHDRSEDALTIAATVPCRLQHVLDIIERVIALLLDVERVLHVCRVCRDVEVGSLFREPRNSADDATDSLTESQLRHDRRGVDANSKAWDVDAFADHLNRDDPLIAGHLESVDQRTGLIFLVRDDLRWR